MQAVAASNSSGASGNNVASNNAQKSALKRKFNNYSVANASKSAKQQKMMTELLQETGGARIWDLPPANNFIGTKIYEINASPTELSNDEINFKITGHDKFTHVPEIQFIVTVKLQKKVNNVWGDCDANDKVIVLPSGVMNLFHDNLEVRMTYPGGTTDTSIINVKQDDRRFITRNEIQRSYDHSYCEKELKAEMQIIRENSYPFLFDATSHANRIPGQVDAANGLRAVNQAINFPADSIHQKCRDFATELKAGKKFVITAGKFDKCFEVPLLQPFQGLDVTMKLGRVEDHALYIEDYTTLAQAKTAQPEFRFQLLKGGNHKTVCRYTTSNLTTQALARYNEQFENNATVEVARGMFFKIDHRNIEQGATELNDMSFPNTSTMPKTATLSMMSRDDYNHTSVRANAFSNIFLNEVEKIKFNSASDLNPTFRDGVSEIDYTNEIDREQQYKLQRRYMLGTEIVDMSDILPNAGLLNGANLALYKNEGESRADFMKMNTERHLTPIPISMDPSHGKYSPDQRPTTMSNTGVSMDFQFRRALPRPCVMILTMGYQGRYVMKKQNNGMITMSFQNIDIPANML